MTKISRRLGTVALAACLLGLPLAACGGDAPPAQGLMVRISTNSPQLVSVVALEIFQGEKRVFRNVATVGTGQGEVTLPAALAVEPGANPRDLVTLIAYVGGKQHDILGKTVAETTIPENRFAVINLNVDIICIQTQETTGTIGPVDTDAHSKCTKGQTCKDGQCATDAVDSSTLGDYNGAASGTVPGGCFDVDACLGAPAAHTVEFDGCTFPAVGNNINVGIVVPGGVPTRFGTVAVLDHVSGWTEKSPGVGQVSSAVCDWIKSGKISKAVVSGDIAGCSSKASEVPVCGISAPGGGDGGVNADGGPVSDPGCECSTPSVCHTGPGVCTGGTCTYPLASVGASCAEGVCDAEGHCVDMCAAMGCNAAPVCHTLAGSTCGAGKCTYPDAVTDVRCSGTCSAGKCSDPCSGVTCDAPPACRVAAGATCEGSSCTYVLAADGATCAGGTCTAGVCSNPNANSCTGVMCTNSNNVCKSNAGTCVSGVCSYPNASNATPCPGGTCDGNGTCQSASPCMGVICASPPVCHSSPGTCSGGVCSYGNAANGAACTGGTCQNGACISSDPCSPNPCNSAPECRMSPGTCFPMMGTAMCSYTTPKPFGATCAVGHCDGAGSCQPGGLDGGAGSDGGVEAGSDGGVEAGGFDGSMPTMDAGLAQPEPDLSWAEIVTGGE